MNKVIGIGHNQISSEVSDELIKKTVKSVVISSFDSWKENKLKKAIDTEHVILDIIAPKERLIATIIQSLQTSLGQKLWEKLTKELAKLNSFEVCDKKDFFKPKTEHFKYIIEKWKTKREDNNNITLEDYIKDLKKEIKKYKKKFKETKKIKIPKGDGLDVWLKKDNINYLLEIKSPHINAGNGNDFSHKLMKQYFYHLFWNPESEVKAQLAIPYNPFNEPYEKAEKGRISPLIKNEDYLVDNDFWKFITGNKNSMKLLKESISELKEDGDLYKKITSLVDHFKK
jgi:deoxyadenosine/deoxycytidine kinase